MPMLSRSDSLKPHGRLRSLLSIAIPTALVLMLLASLSDNGPADLQAVGGAWYIHAPSGFVVESGSPPRTLYRKIGSHFVHVDERIIDHHFYAPDCLVYSALRQSRGRLFAVCGERTPFRIMDGLEWSIEDEGLVQMKGRQVVASTDHYDHTKVKPIAQIIARAMRQPPYKRGWEMRDPFKPGDDPIPSFVVEEGRVPERVTWLRVPLHPTVGDTPVPVRGAKKL